MDFESARTPPTIQETILNYLNEQNLIGVDEFDPYGDLKMFTGREMGDAERTVREEDGITINAHNQHDLFDMNDILPDFDIGLLYFLCFGKFMNVESSKCSTRTEFKVYVRVFVTQKRKTIILKNFDGPLQIFVEKTNV